ncbi:methylenetetrahydrofolate reductase [Micrococcales bacterium 31B]|nr:methylenetetrahydrofolate reductase [Micrococcales bacterium 31B]
MEYLPQLMRRGGKNFSVEFFPPRDDLGEQNLWSTIRYLESRRPGFVSVTYGAGGTNRDRTVRVTERIAKETSLTPVAHLTAVGQTREELEDIMARYAAAYVHNVLVVRGDPKGVAAGQEGTWEPTPGGINSANELLALAKEKHRFCVGVAAFPDKHPRFETHAEDDAHFATKVRAGADFGVSQMLFSADSFVRMRDRYAQQGLDIPVLPGIMPITSWAGLQRMLQLSGQPAPADVMARFEKYRDDCKATGELGVELALKIARDLIVNGVEWLHFFPNNRASTLFILLDELGYYPFTRQAQYRIG